MVHSRKFGDHFGRMSNLGRGGKHDFIRKLEENTVRSRAVEVYMIRSGKRCDWPSPYLQVNILKWPNSVYAGIEAETWGSGVLLPMGSRVMHSLWLTDTSQGLRRIISIGL